MNFTVFDKFKIPLYQMKFTTNKMNEYVKYLQQLK